MKDETKSIYSTTCPNCLEQFELFWRQFDLSERGSLFLEYEDYDYGVENIYIVCPHCKHKETLRKNY